MPFCCIPGCKNRTWKLNHPNHPQNRHPRPPKSGDTRLPALSFFSIPPTDNSFEKWKKQINSDRVTRKSQVCSIHFSPDAFVVRNNRRFLVPGALPTILSVENFSPPFLGDHTYQFPPPHELKERINLANLKIEKLMKRLHNVSKTARYFTKKCQALRSEAQSKRPKKKFRADATFEVVNGSDSDDGSSFAFNTIDINRKLTKKKKMSNEPQTFSIALRFNSLKSYVYVRNTFNFNLPNENVIKQWFNQNNEVSAAVSQSEEGAGKKKVMPSKQNASPKKQTAKPVANTKPNASANPSQSPQPSTSCKDDFSFRMADTKNPGVGPRPPGVKRSLDDHMLTSTPKRPRTIVEVNEERSPHQSNLDSATEVISLDEVIDAGEFDDAIDTILGLSRRYDVKDDKNTG